MTPCKREETESSDQLETLEKAREELRKTVF
jgi:hypothetical protein